LPWIRLPRGEALRFTDRRPSPPQGDPLHRVLLRSGGGHRAPDRLAL